MQSPEICDDLLYKAEVNTCTYQLDVIIFMLSYRMKDYIHAFPIDKFPAIKATNCLVSFLLQS